MYRRSQEAARGSVHAGSMSASSRLRRFVGIGLCLCASIAALGQGGGLTGPPTIAPGPARRVPPPEQRVETPVPPPRPTP